MSYFALPNYQKVAGGRPLVFFFGGAVSQADLDALRTATKVGLFVCAASPPS